MKFPKIFSQFVTTPALDALSGYLQPIASREGVGDRIKDKIGKDSKVKDNNAG